MIRIGRSSYLHMMIIRQYSENRANEEEAREHRRENHNHWDEESPGAMKTSELTPRHCS
jgi:spore cortex formation protein SpoVR/YcgB (stage V sporulation)